MRSMTIEQAELYIKVGYFPKPYETEAIVDLQDVFGHQDYWDVIGWLYNRETCSKAEELYRLIWNDEDVDRMKEYVNKIWKIEAQKKYLEDSLENVNKELDKYRNVTVRKERK